MQGLLLVQTRFSPLAVDEDEPMDVADHQDAVVDYDEGSEVSENEEPEPPTAPDPEVVTTRGLTPAIRAALMELDGVDLPHEFTRRAAVMKTVPHFLRGPFRNALRVAMDEALEENQLRSERGWKLNMLLPKLLLFRPPRGGNVHKSKLAGRFQEFTEGRWMHLLRSSRQCAEDASRAQCKKRRRHHEDDLERRAGRALSLVQMGELSAGRQALEGAPVAPGNRETLNQLQDPVRRPPVMRDPLPAAITEFVSDRSFSLEKKKFASNLRSSRKGAAAGPSGMTADHLRPLLGNEQNSHRLFRMGEKLCQAQTPPSINATIRMGRLTALQKTSRGRSRNFGGKHCETIGLAHNGSAIQQSRGTVHCSLPICNVDKGRH